MIKRFVVGAFDYFIKMNTGTNGKISINRNMAWGIASLMVFVEVYSLCKLPYATDTQIPMYIKLCITYVIVDAAFVSLALGITSVEKLNELAKTIGGRFGGSRTEIAQVPDEKKEPQVTINTSTTVETKQPE